MSKLLHIITIFAPEKFSATGAWASNIYADCIYYYLNYGPNSDQIKTKTCWPRWSAGL